MQERHFRIEQNPIDNCEIHVPRANVNCRQGATMREGTRSDVDETAGQSHARQAGALTESVDANAGDAIRDRDACQAGASSEGISANAGDGITFNGVRNHQFTSGCFITIGDGDLPFSRGPCQVI